MSLTILDTETKESRVVLDPHDPCSHPDFVGCDVKTKWAYHPIVYVANLVYLVHRLGGPDNIDGPSKVNDFGGFSVLYHPNESQYFVRAEKLCGGTEVSAFCLHLSEWHHAEACLTVGFSAPVKWHLGEWEVDLVMCEDMFCATAELARDVALLCDRIVGKRLADDY